MPKQATHIPKPNVDPRMARFRSVIGLYLELLDEGSLDENLIPEIEGVFKEVGALAGLDFEKIRTGLELGEGDKKKKGGRPRNVIKDDALLIADLPDLFSWKDVAEVWGVSRPAAFKRLAKLVKKNLVYAAGPGFYRVSGPGSLETQKPSLETQKKKSLETQKPSLETQKKKSLETPARGKTPKTGKKRKSLETQKPSLETQKKKSLETQKPSLETQKKKSLETQKPKIDKSKLINLAASYPRATGDPATMARADFIPNTGYQAILRSTYFDGQTKKASSRTSPQVPLGLAVGSWRIDDDFKGLHGHEISQLREVVLSDLITSELDELGRVEPVKRADVGRFEHWLEQGREAPPIEVVETNKGKLKITDGHRRYVAAFRQSRKKMLAWVSPGTLVWVSPGNSVFTGLTHELTQSQTDPTVTESLHIETYTDKSFVLRGDTKPLKDQIGKKGLGGKWNRKLRGGPGWIFRIEDLDRVQAWIEAVKSGIGSEYVRKTARWRFVPFISPILGDFGALRAIQRLPSEQCVVSQQVHLSRLFSRTSLGPKIGVFGLYSANPCSDCLHVRA